MHKTKYNRMLIIKTIMQFKKQKLNIKDVNIFFDIDNTLALFSQKGKDKEACAASEKEGFYETLPIFHCVEDILMYLTRLGSKVWILSAYPLRDGEHSAKEEKNIWIEKHLPFIPKERRLLVPVETNKAEVIGSVCDLNTAIIIDDYGENIIQAYEMGVVGVKKTYSGKRRPCPQIQDFYDIFNVFKKLNIKVEED